MEFESDRESGQINCLSETDCSTIQIESISEPDNITTNTDSVAQNKEATIEPEYVKEVIVQKDVQTKKLADETEVIKNSTEVNDLVQSSDKIEKLTLTIDDQKFSSFDWTVFGKKIINVDELPEVELNDNDVLCDKIYENFIKLNKAVLWHVRMGHASVPYLKKLQKLWPD